MKYSPEQQEEAFDGLLMVVNPNLKIKMDDRAMYIYAALEILGEAEVKSFLIDLIQGKLPFIDRKPWDGRIKTGDA